MNSPTLPHALDREVFIRARPATVFGFFTDSARWAAWWGAGSTIDPRPGGRVVIRYPNAVEAGGEVLERHGHEICLPTMILASRYGGTARFGNWREGCRAAGTTAHKPARCVSKDRS